jgi:hypothetical protein
MTSIYEIKDRTREILLSCLDIDELSDLRLCREKCQVPRAHTKLDSIFGNLSITHLPPPYPQRIPEQSSQT